MVPKIRQTKELTMFNDKSIAAQDEHIEHLTDLFENHQKNISDAMLKHSYKFMRMQQSINRNLFSSTPFDWYSYFNDRSERAILTLEVMRESGDAFMESETHGHLPVLEFDSELVIDGKNLDKPVNYVLLRIKHPNIKAVNDTAITASPVVIIDPRAGHGPGIGGFKQDSEVGVALQAGHPVYFVSFKDKPEPSQTTTDVVLAHAQFLKRVIKNHPKAPEPIVIGNCQGGWAGALVSATHPDLIGALVLNGSPLSYWAGKDGQNPMRYLGGMLGGALPAIVASDLSDGTFDGANLVMNFEALNPANTWFRKYKDLFDKVDTEAHRFTEFDRWWSGFYLMNGTEIRWILDNLFIGNKLGKGEVVLDNQMPVDLDNIHSPIFVFASWGDNITPPAQALSWVLDAYTDLSSLKKSSKRIIYTLHNAIGHLGIFVSQQVAQREHQAISSVIDYAKALPPGLYEMVIEQEASPPVVRFYERNFNDLKKLGAEHSENEEFEIIKQNSELLEKWYDNTSGPILKSLKNPLNGEIQRKLHPLRLRRSITSTQNPWMLGIKLAAPIIKKKRLSRDEFNFLPKNKNPIEQIEHQTTNWIESYIQSISTARDAAFELTFHQLYGGLATMNSGVAHRHKKKSVSRKQVNQAHILGDGYDSLRQAAVRMVLLLIKARGGMRGAHLITFKNMMQSNPYFEKLNNSQRESLLAEEAALVSEDHEAALSDLPNLLMTPKEAKLAISILESVVGKAEQLSSLPRNMMNRIVEALNHSTKQLKPQ
ncbi:MAG: hypothetical protein RLY99_1299 [Pseudomonadota bacterium]